MLKALLEHFEGFLRRVFPTRVVFEDGSFIDYLNREALRYSEAEGREMEIVWLFDPTRARGRILNREDINYWDPPHQAEPLTRRKKEEIERKIAEYCNERNIPLEIRGRDN